MKNSSISLNKNKIENHETIENSREQETNDETNEESNEESNEVRILLCKCNQYLRNFYDRKCPYFYNNFLYSKLTSLP